MKYQPKTDKFDAVQFTQKNFDRVNTLVDGKLFLRKFDDGRKPCGEVETSMGKLRVEHNDWLCRSSEGLYFTLPNAHFRDKYEPVDDMTDLDRLGQALLRPTEEGEPHEASPIIERLIVDGTLLSCMATALQNMEAYEVLRLLARADVNIDEKTMDGLIDLYWSDVDASHPAHRSLTFRVLEAHQYRVSDIKKLVAERGETDEWLRRYIQGV